MTAQIFLDRLLHHHRQLLPLSLASVNLLIVDECHHATGNHPMREIMRRYNDLQDYKPELCPRVMGLTACVIQKKCKLREVTKSIRELEKTMFSALVTSADAIAVKKHSTAAKEIVICFETEKLSEYAESIQAQLIGTTSEVHDMHDIDDKQKKLLIKKLQNINEIIVHLGEWCGARAVKYEMENFEETEELEEIPALRYLKKRIIQRLELIYQYCCQNEKNMSDPLRHASKKVQRLCEILSVSKNDACGLIFVYRRNTAKLLYELLLQAAKIHDKLSFIRPAYVIGHNSRIGLDINLIQNELKNQNETLAAFARGETNILVSTSVLEEGLDIRHCNMVIRFDKPMNYRAHVQSRGRARAIPAKYILMIEENSVDEMLSTLELYTEIEAVLTDICHNRELPTDVETAVHFAEDEHIPPYQPYGPYGATVTFNSAVSLISVYCGKLPHDKFTDLIPEICYQQSETGDPKVKAGIRLPINSCLKSTVYGDWMENKDHAKKSAALVLCKKLHQMKELNDYLRPTSKSDITIFDDMVEEVEPSEMSTESDMPQLGTKKHRNVYNKEMCPAFSVMNNDFKLYSVIVQSKGIGNDEIIIDSGRKNISVGLLCKETLNLPPFSLYSSKWDEVMIRIKLIDESLQLDSRTVNHIEHFHKIVFENLLDTSPTLFDFRPQETSLLIVPMRGDQIDTSLLSNSASWKSLRMLDALTASDDIFNFERSLYEDAIIYPLYFPLSEPMYYVTNILDHVGPKDKFPEGGKSYKTFEEYFLFKYERKISNMDQPLMTAKHVPKGKDLNNLQRTVQRTSGKRKNQILGNFVPELCGVLPLRATLWWQIMLIPSVLNRLNYLSMAEELTMMMTSTPSHATPKWQSNETDSLDFDWSSKFIKKIVQPTGNNLSVILSNTEPRPIQPFMIVNALTLKGANDNFDLERLEVLGDAFLKYAVTEYLFLRFPADHEGKLTMKRSKFVSNKNLYLFGMKKQLPGKIHSIKLNPPMNGILPGFVLKHEVEQKLRELNAPYELWPRFADFTEEEFKEEIKKSEGICKTSCYNPWTQHELADKSVADCVEAIIGVGLLVGGRETAIQVLCNFGIGVTNGSSLKTHIPIQSAMLNKEQWAIEEMQKYYQKCCLNVLEEKIQYKFKDRSFIVQAVTHSSFCQNKVTDCYQRLEYLGDAILDYLVTGMVFSGHDYTPGQISDMRWGCLQFSLRD
ncbi:Endoribonuclease Dicer [Chionoecetes opilio]|uniref:Endoribonuclease Dicer n=1 Tax=Chionoecetes opilio TaxID=41210 RepID=A0A8J5D213_CHIOP|nr:Endoribonuclease Dicer [Chionoecetes opilio]